LDSMILLDAKVPGSEKDFKNGKLSKAIVKPMLAKGEGKNKVKGRHNLPIKPAGWKKDFERSETV